MTWPLREALIWIGEIPAPRGWLRSTSARTAPLAASTPVRKPVELLTTYSRGVLKAGLTAAAWATEVPVAPRRNAAALKSTRRHAGIDKLPDMRGPLRCSVGEAAL